MLDENPYAPPKAVEPVRRPGPGDADAWRDGEVLVLRHDAELPDRCLKCASPTEPGRDRFFRTLSWHHPAWFLIFLISWPLYLIAYFLVRKRAWVTVALCPIHRKKRLRAIAVGWLLTLAGIGLIAAAIMLLDENNRPGPIEPMTLLSGIALLAAGVLIGVFGSRVLVPKRIDREYVWLTGVAPALLETLPDWPGPEGGTR
jgi:hypothetical protein